MEEFENHIKTMKNAGINFLTTEEVLKNRYRGINNVLITLDDGKKSNYEAYHKIMKKYGVKPLLAIYPAIIGRMSYAMSWEQLKELDNAGCFVAVHGYNHMYVNQKLFDTDRKTFNREIYFAKRKLTESLDKEMDVYVYPFGVYSDITIDHLKQAGYQYAFSIIARMMTQNDLIANRYELPRYLMTKSNAKRIINKIISESRDALNTPNSQNKEEPIVPKRAKKIS